MNHKFVCWADGAPDTKTVVEAPTADGARQMLADTLGVPVETIGVREFIAGDEQFEQGS